MSDLRSQVRSIPSITDLGSDERHIALTYLSDAWVEAIRDGLDEDCLVQAALFAALRSLVATYGEEASASFVERLVERVRTGEYTIVGRTQ